MKSNKQGNSVIRASVPACITLEVKIRKRLLPDWVMLWSGAYECHNWLSFVFTRWKKRRGYCNFQEWIFSKLNQRSFAFRLGKENRDVYRQQRETLRCHRVWANSNKLSTFKHEILSLWWKDNTLHKKLNFVTLTLRSSPGIGTKTLLMKEKRNKSWRKHYE